MPVEDIEEIPQTAFERHRQTVQVDDERLAIEAAKQEWDNVATIETTYSIQAPPVSHTTYQEAFEYFLNMDMSEHMANIQVEVQRRGLCTLLSCIMGPPHLEASLAEERSLVFAVAQYTKYMRKLSDAAKVKLKDFDGITFKSF